METNPFGIGEHVTVEYFTDRETEVAQIRTAILNPSSLLVYGPRRMGKSSAIRAAAEAARASRPKPIVIGADLSTATSLFDLSARLLRSLYVETRSLRIRLEELLGGLAPRVTVTFDETSGAPSISFGVERRTATDEEKRRALESVVGRLAELRARTSRPVAVVLDEFQAIQSLGGETGEWHLRDLIQRHGDLSFICAGSQESLINEMIGPKRAFYKMFEVVHLGPLEEPHFAAWIDRRLRLGVRIDGEIGLEVVHLAGPRTQDVVQVARQLYFRGRTSEKPIRPSDVMHAMDDVVRGEDPLIRSLWNEISAQQQDVLRVLALGIEQIFSSEARDRYGLPGPSSVHKAVETLISRGLLVSDGKQISFDSPFVRRWVRREVAPDLG